MIKGKLVRSMWIMGMLLLCNVAKSEERYVIKFATLAPKGSGWMALMDEFNRTIQQKTGGRLRFKVYPGGISGDEKDIVKKMKIGQLHGAALSGVGLSRIVKEVHLLNLPFTFQSYEEVDYVASRLYDEFYRLFEQKGYILLTWTEVGFVYFFSKYPIRSIEDLRKYNVKMWMWEGDMLNKAMFKNLDIAPVSLSLPDVLPSLQTGIIDTIYAPYLVALILQWYTKVKYISEISVAYGCGGFIIRKKFFDRLPKNMQDILKDYGHKLGKKFVTLSRKNNNEAKISLLKQGLKLIPQPTPEDMKKYYEIGRNVRRELTGKLYSKDLLDKLMKLIDEFRMNRAKQ